VRFDSARAAGLDEEKVGHIEDGYAAVLAPHEVAALQLTDALVGVPQLPDAATRAALRAHFSEAQVVELALGVGLFMGMSKVLITLGLEPETMPVTVLPTPGSG
jgi:alkylhydroperoxidase family enzyme